MILTQNPFFILDVSPRDRKELIIERAAEKSLFISPEDCEKAKAILLNPRKRIEAEVSWLPGLSPDRTKKIMNDIQNKLGHELADDIRELSNLDNAYPLVLCNFFATLYMCFYPGWAYDYATAFQGVSFFCDCFEKINTEEVLVLINEDRKISGFPEISEIDPVQQELDKLRSYYIESILNCVNSTNDSPVVFGLLAENLTDNAKKHAPFLFEKVIDRYHIGIKRKLDEKAQVVRETINQIKEFCGSVTIDQQLLDERISSFEVVLRAWAYLAYPIQVIQKSRGAGESHSEYYDFVKHIFSKGPG